METLSFDSLINDGIGEFTFLLFNFVIDICLIVDCDKVFTDEDFVEFDCTQPICFLHVQLKVNRKKKVQQNKSIL